MSKMKKATNPEPLAVAASSEFGASSCIIRNDKRQDIHNENVNFLKQHTEEDILMEQQRLLGMMGESGRDNTKMGLNLLKINIITDILFNRSVDCEISTAEAKGQIGSNI